MGFLVEPDTPVVWRGPMLHSVIQQFLRGVDTGITREPPVRLAIRYDGDVVIESFTTDVKVIARAAAIWRRIEPTRNEIAVKGLKFLRQTLK